MADMDSRTAMLEGRLVVGNAPFYRRYELDIKTRAMRRGVGKFIAEKIDVESRDQMLAYADKLREKMKDGIVLLGANLEGKAALLCLVTEGVFKEHKVKAGDLINKVAVHVDGRGGGRPTLAQAGGSKPEGLPQAVASFEDAVREALT